MKNYWIAGLAATLMLFQGSALAGLSEQEEVSEAITVLTDFVTIPENAIPPALLQSAYGIAVIPNVLKVGFILGGQRGSGILSVRTESGAWSRPVFVTITGGSLGWQIGASSTDLILIFKTRDSVDDIANGQFTLGGTAAIAAGPVGRSASATTSADLEAEIYSYSRSRGLFAGVAVKGALLGVNDAANADFYGKPGIGVYEILENADSSGIPEVGQKFVQLLTHYLPRPN